MKMGASGSPSTRMILRWNSLTCTTRQPVEVAKVSISPRQFSTMRSFIRFKIAPTSSPTSSHLRSRTSQERAITAKVDCSLKSLLNWRSCKISSQPATTLTRLPSNESEVSAWMRSKRSSVSSLLMRRSDGKADREAVAEREKYDLEKVLEAFKRTASR